MALRRTLIYGLGAVSIASLPCRALAAWLDAPSWGELKLQIRTRFPEVLQMTLAELQRAQRNVPRPVLLDARARPEFEVSHLEHATWTPDLASALQHLGTYGKDVFVVVYCSVGWRSSALARQLMQSNYTRVFNLEGSLFAWANAGLPVIRDGLIVKQVHPYNAHWSSLLQSQLRAPL